MDMSGCGDGSECHEGREGGRTELTTQRRAGRIPRLGRRILCSQYSRVTPTGFAM
jgi:hypothetical protein